MSEILKKDLFSYIFNTSFPCIMAKAAAKKGFFQVHAMPDKTNDSVRDVLTNLQNFVGNLEKRRGKLSSFALVLEDESLRDFNSFEIFFWSFLKELNALDKKDFLPDPTVASDPSNSKFSFSIGSESFFIIALHPESPRWARRFKKPTIVFNPHIQFEDMRRKGTFQKIRDLIRSNEIKLQGASNPMLSNFGERSEVFQYLGKIYKEHEPVPLTY